MERMCGRCGGLIGVPGKAYGWAGLWCHCPRLADFLPPAEISPLPSKIGTPIFPAPAPAPAPAPYTPADFVHWLRGYVAHGHVDPKILAELQRVKS